MLRSIRIGVIALLFLPAPVALATVASAQDAPTRAVTGTVRDTSGIPIAFVNVQGPKNLRALSDEEGHFRLVLPTGGATSLMLLRLGYRPVTVALPAGTDTALFVHLDLIPQQLNAVRVVTSAIQSLRNKGFYARMAEREQGASSGQFITPEEIELRKPSRPTQLLEARMSVVVRRVGKCYVIAQCWVATGFNGCPMQIYLDGQRLMPERLMNALNQSGGNLKADEYTSVFLDALITPSAIAGIEIYPRGASAPPQYQMMNSTCGVILIWTK